MNITIIAVGEIKEKYLKLGIDEFSKRLTKYCKLDVIELDDEKCPENLSEKDMLIVKDKEGKKIISKIKNKLKECNPNEEYIENVWSIGYRLKN